jgi:glucokinase
MTRRPFFVGLDVGGTTIKSGVVDGAGRLLCRVSMPTEAARGQEHGLATMALCVRKAVEVAGITMDAVAAIGVATPGSMDIPAGVIIDPPNLRPWHNVPVRQFMADTFHKPIAFQNDANAAAYGEFWVGAGQAFKSMVLFTLGTGIGGGIILDGKILEGAHSHGGELGHTKIALENGRLCGCGQRGCLEAYASATAVVQRTYETLVISGEMSDLSYVLRDRGELTAEDVFDAAAGGDYLAAKIVDRTAYYLAIGAANVMQTINPELICFAGGMMAAGAPLLDRIRHYVPGLAFPVPAERTVIEHAQLGSDAGVVGAAGCARMLIV